MKKLLVLLATVAVAASVSVGAAKAYTVFFTSVQSDISSTTDQSIGSLLTPDSATVNAMTQDWGVDMTAFGDESLGTDNDMSAQLMPPCPYGTTCSSGLPDGEAVMARTGGECDTGVKMWKGAVTASYHFGTVNAKVESSCNTVYPVSVSMIVCIVRSPGDGALPWKPTNCAGRIGVDKVKATLHHACDYTTFPYTWRTDIQVNFSYPGGFMSRHYRSRKHHWACV